MWAMQAYASYNTSSSRRLEAIVTKATRLLVGAHHHAINAQLQHQREGAALLTQLIHASIRAVQNPQVADSLLGCNRSTALAQ